MFSIEIKPEAIKHLAGIKRYYAVQIITSVEKYLRYTPDKPTPPRIKILRGHQQATYRLREGDYRIFYDVMGGAVKVTAILHKYDTKMFYEEE